MGIPESKEKILVVANNNSFSIIWWIDYIKSRFSSSSIYLYNFLSENNFRYICFYHDSAACLLVDGNIIAAAQEERFTRIKHDKNYPFNAIEFV